MRKASNIYLDNPGVKQKAKHVLVLVINDMTVAMNMNVKLTD